MSDGMSDARAHGEQEANLRQSAYDLAEALEAAEAGHRGWGMSRAVVIQIVNQYFKDKDLPFALERREVRR